MKENWRWKGAAISSSGGSVADGFHGWRGDGGGELGSETEEEEVGRKKGRTNRETGAITTEYKG